MKKPLLRVLMFALVTCLLLTSCGPATPVTPSNGEGQTPGAPSIDQSKVDRVSDPKTTETDLQKLVSGNTAFAFDLYQAVSSGDGNLVYSPYSLSLAFALAYAGARGDTADQMAQVLHYTLPPDLFHSTFDALDLDLAKRPDQATNVDESDRFQLNIANSIWGQQGFQFLQSYLDLLASNYGAGMRLVDFSRAPDNAAKQINDWVAEQTKDRIKNIIPGGALDPATRLVLANAIYFKAVWEAEFDASLTSDQSFHLLDGSTVPVKMMSQGLDSSFNYAAGTGWQAISLPYKGGLNEMVLIVPDSGQFAAIQKDLNAGFFNEVVASLQPKMVHLSMPKFTFETPYQLNDVLSGMGMSAAFEAGKADFSGIDGARDLFIGAVLHKAFVAVDEKGTEAAAATVIIMPAMAASTPPLRLTIDRPFFFFIRDVPTGSILFMGRVLDPSK